MPQITLRTLSVKGRTLVLTDKQAAEFLPEHVKTHEFAHSPCQGRHLVEVGQRIVAAGLYDRNGHCDAAAEAFLRAQVLAEKLLTGWNRTDGDGQPLPLTPENIAALPADVLLEVGRQLEGETVTAADIAALKKPAPPSTPTA